MYLPLAYSYITMIDCLMCVFVVYLFACCLFVVICCLLVIYHLCLLSLLLIICLWAPWACARCVTGPHTSRNVWAGLWGALPNTNLPVFLGVRQALRAAGADLKPCTHV